MKNVNTQIRIPLKLHRELRREAKKNLRSMNSEIIKRLAESLCLETEEAYTGKVTRLKTY
jgi:hypothetical protein